LNNIANAKKSSGGDAGANPKTYAKLNARANPGANLKHYKQTTSQRNNITEMRKIENKKIP